MALASVISAGVHEYRNSKQNQFALSKLLKGTGELIRINVDGGGINVQYSDLDN